LFNVDQAAQQGFEAVAWVLSLLNSFAGDWMNRQLADFFLNTLC
jgi:hypothetical protein